MKKILGLDLGTSSIGWAYVHQAEAGHEQSEIIKLGVRVNPLAADELANFEAGKSITATADRTLKRSMRRNLQRYKLRRDNLIEILKSYSFIDNKSILCESGNFSTFETYRLRAKAATEVVSLEELARILLMINKKRGYKSSRKLKIEADGQAVDSMELAKRMYEEHLTPGAVSLELLEQGKKCLPDFYRSDIHRELDLIWDYQRAYYPDILTDDFKSQIVGKSKSNTSKIFLAKYGIYTADIKAKNKKLQTYQLRVGALSYQLSIEELALIISDINGCAFNSSGYLGAISDRSKELYFSKKTVGQYLMAHLEKNPNYSFKNQVFYRQDYLDEFNTIWETQAQYHNELTDSLKSEIRDVAIFYQRPLESQKGLLSFCEFEQREIVVEIDGKPKKKLLGLRVAPKSSPLFQEFRIWQRLNDIEVKEDGVVSRLTQEQKERLSEELSIKPILKKEEILKLLYPKKRGVEINFKEITGNRTQATLFKTYQNIIERSGHGEYNFEKMEAERAIEIIRQVFEALHFSTDILTFNSELEGVDFQNQPMYRFWHLLYSFEGDNSKSGYDTLVRNLIHDYGFEREYALLLANTTFEPDYCSLSTKAMRKILTFMKEGHEYSLAAEYGGYKHSKSSLSKEDLDQKVYKDRLEILPKNSLRNPVVEKILNQMAHVINGVIDTYGKPDEIHIELARELKKNAKERALMSQSIEKSTREHESYKRILKSEFGLSYVSRNDLIRYKLYNELKNRGYKTLYSNTYIPREKLFSKEFDIEHIIPQAKLFDDSFSNKTIELRSVNIEKSNTTAYDYIMATQDTDGVSLYEARVEELYKIGSISRAKYLKLKMREADIPDGFIERDLRDSQYIARKAKSMLEDMVREVVSTSGSITDRLRSDWQLIDVMQELNWSKYDQLGLTETFENRDGHRISRIVDWTKRNDHRHHAMDALTVAFTKRSHIQYLNNLNARSDKSSSIYLIEQKELSRDPDRKLRFVPPFPLTTFRAEAKRHLENTIISVKTKNKVTTRNGNYSAKAGGYNKKIQLTPRDQLHKETIYGSSLQYVSKVVKVGSTMTADVISRVAQKCYREALLTRLQEFDGDPKRAFTGKNSLDKNPIYIGQMQTASVPQSVRIVSMEPIYTIRKAVDKDINIEKVVDPTIKRLLLERLEMCGGDRNKAFSNLEENPIWLNQSKGIAIKRITIIGASNPMALHDKRDHRGQLILNDQGDKQSVDFVITGNNHHIAIYRDAEGKLQEYPVSFFEAIERVNSRVPIVDKMYNQDQGWSCLFTMKKNEFFVFPNTQTGFNPQEIDLLDPENYALISPNLYRVQKLASKDYYFRHHLETTVVESKPLLGTTYKRVGLLPIEGIVKVRVDHIGRIVSVGEY